MMRKESKTVLKRILSCVIALILILSVGTPELSEAASKKKITVTTQKELDEALKSGKYTTIVIKTDENIKITLKKKYASSKVKITVNAPNCDLVSNGTFKSISVTNANSVTDKAAGNSYTIKDRDLTFNISEKAKVDEIKVVSKTGNVSLINDGTVKRVDVESEAKVDIEQNGKIKRVYVNSETEITVTGDSDKAMNVTFKKGAEGATLTTDIPVNVNSYAQVNLELSETAKDSKVTEKSEEAKVEVKNITEADKKEEKKEDKKEDKKDSDKKEDKTEGTGSTGTSSSDSSYVYVPTDYEILQNRLYTAAYQTGDNKTVKLDKNITLFGNLIIPAEVVLDLGGFTLNAGDHTILMEKNAYLNVTQNSKLIANHIIALASSVDEDVYMRAHVLVYPTGEAILGGVSMTAGPAEHPSLVGADIHIEAYGGLWEKVAQEDEDDDDEIGKHFEVYMDSTLIVAGESVKVTLDLDDLDQLADVFNGVEYYEKHLKASFYAAGADYVDIGFHGSFRSYSMPNFRFTQQKLICNDKTVTYDVTADHWLDMYLGQRLSGKEDLEDAINNFKVTPPIDITSTEEDGKKYVTIKSNDGTGKIHLEYLDLFRDYSLTLKDEVEINTSTKNGFLYALNLNIEGELKSEVAASRGTGMKPSENGCIVLGIWNDGKLILNDGTEIYLADIPEEARDEYTAYIKFYIQNSNTELGNYDWFFPAASPDSGKFKIMMKKDGVETEMIPDPISGMLRPKGQAAGKITELTELMSVLDWSAWTALNYYNTHYVNDKRSYDGLYTAYPMLADTFVVEKGSEIKVGKVIGNYENEFETEFLNLNIEDNDGDKSTIKVSKDHYFVVSCNSNVNIPSLGYSYTQTGETPVVSAAALELEFDSEKASFIAADDGSSIRIGNMIIETPSREGREPGENEYKTFPVYISPERKLDGSVFYNIILSPEDKFFVLDGNGTKTAATLDQINAWLAANNFVVPVSDKEVVSESLCIKIGDNYAVYDASSNEYVAKTRSIDVSQPVIEIYDDSDVSVFAAMMSEDLRKAEDKRVIKDKTINITSGAAVVLNGFYIGDNVMKVSSGCSITIPSDYGIFTGATGKLVAESGSRIILENDAELWFEVTENHEEIEVREGALISGNGLIAIIYFYNDLEDKAAALIQKMRSRVSGTGVRVVDFWEEYDD